MHFGWFLFSRQKKARNSLYIINALMVLLFFFSPFSYAEANDKAFHCLNIKEVLNSDENMDSNYEYGKKLYPQYKYHGLPDNFLIRKTPDVSIRPTNIKLVEIRKIRFSPESMPVYTVSIHFNPLAAKIINSYMKKNLNKRIALEIDDKIFAIVKILDVAKDEINITLGKISLKNLEDELRKISNNVIISKGGDS